MSTLDYAGVNAVSEGTVFVTIDGKNVPLIEVKEAKAKVELNKEDVRGLGKRLVGQKVTSAKGTGTLTTYFVTSMWVKMLADYQATGYLPRMTMTATMEDKSAQNGKHVVSIGGFMPDNLALFQLEADDGIAENEMDFTFDSISPIEAFKEPTR